MFLHKTVKNFGYFELRKAIVKNPVFVAKMSINRF